MKDGFHLRTIYEGTSSKRGFVDGPKVAQPAGGGAGPGSQTGAPTHPCIRPLFSPSAPGRVPHHCSDVKLLPSSLCICMLRVFEMVLP